MTRARPFIRLILDFDGTLTKKDTLHLLAEAGYRCQKQKARETTSRPVPSWAAIVDAYSVDFNRHVEAYKPDKQSRRSAEQEVTWLNSLWEVETASAERVYQAGIFDDVKSSDLSEVAIDALQTGQISLQAGWSDLLQLVTSLNRGVDQTDKYEGETSDETPALQVISVNWSRWFIWSVLKNAMSKDSSHLNDSGSVRLAIYANELPSIDGCLRQTEEQDNHLGLEGRAATLRISRDKVKQMLQSATSKSSTNEDSSRIYIGDSTTDLECLLAADTGICIRDDPMGGGQTELADACGRIGVFVRHISEHEAVLDRTTNNLNERGLWWARDFTEIVSWLRRVGAQAEDPRR